MSRYDAVLLVALVLVGTASCGSAKTSSSSPSSQTSLAPASSLSASDAIANGRAIFRTGKDSAGLQIAARPAALLPSCAACHGANGAGNLHLPGGAVSADLRHKALVTTQGAHPYTLPLLKRAISIGIDDDGQPLNPVMPRWKLSPRDLNDVSMYVFTQLK